MPTANSKKAEDTLELPHISKDPVVSHLRRVEEEYLALRSDRNEISAALDQAKEELERVQSLVSDLEAGLLTAQAESKARGKELNKVHAELSELRNSLQTTSRDLEASVERIQQEEQKAARYRERSTHLTEGLKHIHRALFEGGVYGLILKACLAITGATRGLYITTRGDEHSLRIRAAEDIDGYPAAPPSEFIKAICAKVLEDNDSFVCNSEADLGSMPKPERPGEHFQNLVATQVVLLKSLNGIIIAADKMNGDFDEDDIETLLSVGDQAAIAVENRYLQRELQNSYVATVSMLADAVEAKDPYTHGHCDLVSRYARLTAERLSVDDDERSVVCYSALLHDVGKIAVSDGILNKPGPLLPEERDLMRAHVRVGHDLLAKIPALSTVADVVLHHHEWYDGTGYPDGLKGESIPLAARIVCVVDAFCAMITQRSYKVAYSAERARAELLRCSGTQFDPVVVKAFIDVLDSPEAIDVDNHDYDSACDLPPTLPMADMRRKISR